GSFSETTTASFSADMAIGALDGIAGQEAVTALYGFQIDLNTSFTGEDSLDISIDAGNGAAAGDGLDELDLNETNDGLTVDGVSYTFPLGDKTTVFVGDNVDGSALYSTACVYGGPSNTLDDCGNAASALAASRGTAAGASFDIGNGFTAAIGYEGQGSTTVGLLTKEGADAFGGQLTYTADSYGASVTYASIESVDNNGAVVAGQDFTYWGLNGYWTPSESGSMPSISVGYEMGNPEAAGAEDTTHYFVGLQWDEAGPGTFGAALGTTQHTAESADEFLMYEAFYTYPINDGMTVTPLVFVKETNGDDQTGIMVKTSFSF
ncbi:porin, partial [Prochlorococcus marinus]|uniref:porin n=1 Tax=Prochlorococcus marinus TaxID=1219 RepID=UPI001C57E5A3